MSERDKEITELDTNDELALYEQMYEEWAAARKEGASSESTEEIGDMAREARDKRVDLRQLLGIDVSPTNPEKKQIITRSVREWRREPLRVPEDKPKSNAA